MSLSHLLITVSRILFLKAGTPGLDLVGHPQHVGKKSKGTRGPGWDLVLNLCHAQCCAQEQSGQLTGQVLKKWSESGLKISVHSH